MAALAQCVRARFSQLLNSTRRGSRRSHSRKSVNATAKAKRGSQIDQHYLFPFGVLHSQEEVVAPGHVLVVPKRMGARNILDLKPDELRDLMVAVQKAGIAQRKGLGATGFRVSQNNGISANQTVYHAHFHVVPFFGDGPPGTPAPRRKLSPEEYASIAAKLSYATS